MISCVVSALPPGDTVPIVYEAGCAPRPVWTVTENLAPSRIRSSDSPTHSESLFRLRYPGSNVHVTEVMNLQLRDPYRKKILITVRDSIRFVVFFLLGDPCHLNFMCRRFRTHFSIFIGRVNKKLLFTLPTNRSAFRAQLSKCSADSFHRERVPVVSPKCVICNLNTGR